MRVKQSLPRSKAKEKVLRAPNKPQIRRCAVKLRRVTLNASKVNGVASDKNENCDPLLLEQQTIAQKNASKVNKAKRPNDTGISQPKLKKCVVRIKRIHLNGDAPKKLPTPISRNPALALTSRRAKELGVKKAETKAIAVTSPAKEAKNSKQQIPLHSPIESTSPRNLAKKTSIISELLFSEDEELLQSPNVDEQNNISSKNTGNQSTVVHKFFHKDNKNAQQNVKKTEKPINPKITNNKRKKHVNPKLKTQPRRKTATPAKKDIYEFLSQSQSQTSDSDGVKSNKDVASDIIKKLIDEGKVVVTKNCKGRPRAVRKHTKNQKNKMKTLNKNVIEQKQVENENIFNDVDDDIGVGNHNDEIERFGETTALPVFSNKNATSVFSKPRNDEEAHTTANSTFSELARSVLVRKAEKRTEIARKNIADGKTALEILQRWNSTPFKPQQKSPQLPHEVNFSPIQSEAQTKTKTNALTLPNRSNKELFETSNIELPSTSNSGSNKTLPNTHNTLPRNTNIPSSFSSNDSNAENQPPPPQSMASSSMSTMFRSNAMQAPQNENDVIHNARQIPNPRRALQHRSPLKAINIIDIVSLPPYTGPSTLGNKTKSNENETKEKSDEKSKLFGFEEYIDENSLSDNDPENAAHNNNRTKSTKSSKLNINKQLRKLKRLRPRTTTLTSSHSRSTITKNIFDDDDGIAGKRRGNRNIKEMLCSTMVSDKQKASTSNMTAASVSDSDDSDNEASLEKKTAELFGDPETTFDQKSFRRTYERPLKRKRKLIHPFSDIFESDHENSDDEEDEFDAHEAKAKARKAKKRHVESPQHEELDKFVSEFNSMLKEAEDYELVVE